MVVSRSYSEKHCTAMAIGITCMITAGLSIAIGACFVWSVVPTAQKWNDAKCFATTNITEDEYTPRCACYCECREGSPQYSECYDVNSMPQSAMHSDCVDEPCSTCTSHYPYCLQCSYKEYKVRIQYRYWSLQSTKWVYNYKKTFYGTKDGMGEWKNKYYPSFDCSYKQVYYGESDQAVYGHRQSELYDWLTEVCIILGCLSFLFGILGTISFCASCRYYEHV